MTTDAPYKKAGEALRARFGAPPTSALVLGSGLGRIFDELDPCEGEAPFGDVGLPDTGVAGHSGRIGVGQLGSARVAVLAGRVHLYEGHPNEMIVRAVRALSVWGVERIVLTNAVGGIRPEWAPGTLVRVTDHINLQGRNPLTGPNDSDLGVRFPDLSHAYDPELGGTLEGVAADLGMHLAHGVYAGMPGPSYETPAEIRMLRGLGADVVGMSLISEVIAANHAGLRVIAVSTVSNAAAGLGDEELTHSDVTRVMDDAASSLARLLIALVQRW